MRSPSRSYHVLWVWCALALACVQAQSQIVTPDQFNAADTMEIKATDEQMLSLTKPLNLTL